MSNDYFKAQGWFKDYARNSQDSRGMFQRVVEADRLASAETDRIRDMINKKHGPGSMKYGSEIPPIQNPYKDFEERNPAAEGGRIRFEEGLRVEDLNPLELRAAKKAARDRGISGTVDNPEFIEFVGGDEYVRKSTVEKQAAKKLGISYKKYQKLSFDERKKLRTDLWNKKVKESSKYLRPEASVEEVIETIHTDPKKISNFNKNTLNNSYRKWFREEYDNLVKSGEPFARTEVSGRVIQRIKDTYTRDGVLPKEFLPGYTDNPGTKNYDEFFVPKNPKDKIFSDAELKVIQSGKGPALKATKNNLRIFNALYDGINEVDDIAKMLDMPVSEVRATVNTVMNGMTRTQLPYYLQDKIDDFGTVINNLAGSESLDDLWRRNTKTLIYSAFPEDSKSRNRAFKKIDEFENYIKDIKKQFPGLQTAYDHPAGYAALKSQNINNFLNITPIANDINIFKGNFDTKSKNNLVAMDNALKNGDMTAYKSLLKDQRKLEKLWNNLTGGKSTLGKIRLGKVIDYGTGNILEDQKSFANEFKDNIKIRENISKNLTDENIKIMNEVFPGGKYYKTKMLESAKKITSPDLVDFDKQVEAYVTDRTGKVKRPSSFIGVSSGLNTDLIAQDLKRIMDSETFKTFKAKIANPALEAAGKAVKTGAKVAALPTKVFSALDFVFGYFDYANNRQKGWSVADSTKHMVDAVLINTTSFGKKGDIAGVREIANKNGMSNEVFDNLMALNLNQKKMMDTIDKSKAKFNESMDIIESGASDPNAEKMLIQKLKKDTNTILAETMRKIVDDSRSLNTNLQVQEAGAPIDINVDTLKAYGDLGSASRKFVQNRIDASDLENIANQKDTTKGGIGDATMSGLKGVLSQGKFIYDLINPLSPLPKPKDFFPKDLNYKDQMAKLKKEDPTMYYKMLMSEGVDPRIKLNIPVHLEWEQKYPEFGTQYSDSLTQNKAEGGITTLRSKYEYKK